MPPFTSNMLNDTVKNNKFQEITSNDRDTVREYQKRECNGKISSILPISVS